MVLIHLYIVSPIGYGGWEISMLLLTPVFLLLPLSLLAGPLSILLLPFHRLRRFGVLALSASFAFLITFWPCWYLSEAIRMSAFHRLAQRSRPLVSAIHEFEDEQGRPPTDLGELIPTYLPRIPGTGMPAYPAYEYSLDSGLWCGNPWTLSIYCPLNWSLDQFLYFPLQNYPPWGYSGLVEIVDDWAYIHD